MRLNLRKQHKTRSRCPFRLLRSHLPHSLREQGRLLAYGPLQKGGRRWADLRSYVVLSSQSSSSRRRRGSRAGIKATPVAISRAKGARRKLTPVGEGYSIAVLVKTTVRLLFPG